MGSKGKWFEFSTGTLTRYLFGNPVRKAGFLILRFGLTALAAPALILLLLKWAGIIDLVLGPVEIAISSALVLLGLTVIIGEYAFSNRPPRPDQLRLDLLRQRLPRDMVDFIRDHQFANGIRLGRICGAIELADEWRSAETRFRDAELQSALQSLIGASQRLTSIIRQEMRAVEPDSDFMQIRDRENGYGHERPYHEIARDLQTYARQINEAYEAVTIRAQALQLRL